MIKFYPIFLVCLLSVILPQVCAQEPQLATPAENIESTSPSKKSDQNFVNPIPEREFIYSGGRYTKQIFRYRLHIPEMEPGKTYPLILWLHGYGGEFGENNQDQLGHSQFMFSKGSEKSKYPFFVLFPQCPTENRGWYSGRNNEDQMGTVALAMVDDICNELPVDRNRIVLFGISGGATACWRMLAENPDRFAAVVLTGAGGCEPSRLASIPKNVPIWAFHYDSDGGVPIKYVRESIEKIRESGATAALTVFQGSLHSAWEPAYLEMNVLDWMLLQNRNGYCWYPPGMSHWPNPKWSVAYSWFSCSWLPILLIGIAVTLRYDRIRKFNAITKSSDIIETPPITETDDNIDRHSIIPSFKSIL